jgi:predicted transcriptional regulator
MSRPRIIDDSMRAKILRAIGDSPGIALAELRARLPDIGRTQLNNALHELRNQNRVEAADRCGRYRLSVRAAQRSPAGAGQTAPMAKLMAGR